MKHKKNIKSRANLREDICLGICPKSIVRCCWRRLYMEPCRPYMKEFIKLPLENEAEKERRMKAKYFSYMKAIGEDTFDSMGDDIGKEEFLENEIFFETQ